MAVESTRRLGDRYEMGGLLGRGGMADVRVGQDLRLGRTVAIKVLRRDLANDPTFHTRFRREAQSAASLNHPAIVAVYDTGEDVHSDDSLPYIVMEYVSGRTLRDILREGRKILPERALEITADVLSALDYSHRMGIIHRDIKPANVMLTPSGQVKVMDFGIARAVADTSATVTQTAAVVGTAQYLSPEQARGEHVDARTDIYSTGCLLFELLTGRPPFLGDSPVSIAYQHVREEARSPSHYNPEIPAAIDAIVAKSLAKPTGDRYQSAAEMRADIERFLLGHAVAAPVVETATAVVPAVVAGSDTTFLPLQDPHDGIDDRSRSRTGLWLALSVLLLALIAGGAFAVPALLGSGSPQRDIQVPNVVNMTEPQARAKIKASNLSVTVTSEPSDVVGEGRVISQDPKPPSFLAANDLVALVVSTGPATIPVPVDLVGKTRAAAAAELRSLNLQPAFAPQESGRPNGTVLQTDPAGGTPVSKGSTVTLTYSSGLPPSIPDVVGMAKPEAKATLKAAGYRVDVVKSADTSRPQGTVIDQAPAAGESAPAKTIVVITVTGRAPPTTSPTTEPTTPPTTEPTTPPTSPTPSKSPKPTKPTKSPKQ